MYLLYVTTEPAFKGRRSPRQLALPYRSHRLALPGLKTLMPRAETIMAAGREQRPTPPGHLVHRIPLPRHLSIAHPELPLAEPWPSPHRRSRLRSCLIQDRNSPHHRLLPLSTPSQRAAQALGHTTTARALSLSSLRCSLGSWGCWSLSRSCIVYGGGSGPPRETASLPSCTDMSCRERWSRSNATSWRHGCLPLFLPFPHHHTNMPPPTIVSASAMYHLFMFLYEILLYLCIQMFPHGRSHHLLLHHLYMIFLHGLPVLLRAIPRPLPLTES